MYKWKMKLYIFNILIHTELVDIIEIDLQRNYSQIYTGF